MMVVPSRSQKNNSPVEKEKLLFSLELIVQTLSKESRRILVEEFSEELEKLGYTKQYVSMLSNGRRTLGNDALKRLLINSSEALDRAVELLKMQIKQLEEAAKVLKAYDLTPLKEEYGPKIEEKDEEEFEEGEEE